MEKAIKILAENNFTVKGNVVDWNDNITLATSNKVREQLFETGYKIELVKNQFILKKI